jgi:aspartate/methionine/tyrosine aminotransferase
MHIAPFGVEQWMNAYETRCRHNLAETCVESLTLAELLDVTGHDARALDALLPRKLTYGDIEGSPRLRTAIAALYDDRRAEDVLVAHGAIGANALIYQGLVDAGDRVVSIVPNYQQHWSIPESLGATVARLELRAEDGYLPDYDRLESLVVPGTKLIALSNPNNPTGALIDRAGLARIATIADRVGAYVLCDEVYRGTAQANDELGPSMADLYPRAIAVGSMSKAFSLAGLRLGWAICPPEVHAAATLHRDYNTISVGLIDDHLASLALEQAQAILARSRRIVRANLARLDAWIASEPRIHWVRPTAGTVTLLRYEATIDSVDFCRRLLEDHGVLYVPGSVLGMEGHVRVGFGNRGVDFEAGLPLTSRFLDALER